MTPISAPNKISLREGETLSVEPGGMLAYQNLAMKTTLTSGSVFQKMTRYTLGGEPLFRNLFTAEKGGGWIALEEHLPGQVVTKDLKPNEPALMIRRTALLASTPNVELETKFLGLRGYMKGTGIAVLRASVKEEDGKVYFHATDGVVKAFQIRPEDGKVTIDNDMILAYSENLKSDLKRAGSGTKSLFLSGEGLVCEFSGEGTVYVASGAQTGQVNFLDEMTKKIAEKTAEHVTTTAFAAAGSAAIGLTYYYFTGENPLRSAALLMKAWLDHKIKNG